MPRTAAHDFGPSVAHQQPGRSLQGQCRDAARDQALRARVVAMSDRDLIAAASIVANELDTRSINREFLR